MRKLIAVIIIVTGIALLFLSFLIGKWWGSASTSGQLMSEEMRRSEQLATLDREMLRSVPARSNTMSSGTFLMDIWFTKSKLPTREIVLHCEKGQLSVDKFNRNGQNQSLPVEGSVVSWTQEGAGYEPSTKYVGLVDGNQMWGRVYGWNPGDQSVGFWRIYPKPSDGSQTHDIEQAP